MNTESSLERNRIFVHLFFIFICVLCLIPLIIVVSISLSSEADIYQYGYMLFPKNIDLTAYRYIFANPDQIVHSYMVTIFVTVVGTFLSVLLMALIAYPLSRTNYKARKFVMFYVFFTMLFSGGLIPSYILITQYLKLSDTIWVLFIPGVINVFHIILLRTFFQDIPISLIESAKIDGSSEFRVFFQIVLPLSTPVIATVAFLGAMIRWNDWFASMLYIRSESLITLQYLLVRIMSNITFMTMNMDKLPAGIKQTMDIPNETARMAMLVLAAGPMLFVFPFFQKYFVKGLTVGAVKG